jgi:hypothetical protein
MGAFFFSFLFQDYSLFSVLESEWWFEIATQLADTEKRPFSHFMVYGLQPVGLLAVWFASPASFPEN